MPVCKLLVTQCYDEYSPIISDDGYYLIMSIKSKITFFHIFLTRLRPTKRDEWEVFQEMYHMFI